MVKGDGAFWMSPRAVRLVREELEDEERKRGERSDSAPRAPIQFDLPSSSRTVSATSPRPQPAPDMPSTPKEAQSGAFGSNVSLYPAMLTDRRDPRPTVQM
eukprot:CAMPEP_0169442420 /NCGR_PEP_ID=MMETSP1042-20121227/8816_1 /TAXON_ID=464988 /ORGANISM="Hemiselmis andersenii, Strain CCMP1180" /LENGTH=100 /DNA_ID=CAMNT_0009553587 /DNA_START=20 /DNA_END=322 /DNA_ORIENTATION=-